MLCPLSVDKCIFNMCSVIKRSRFLSIRVRERGNDVDGVVEFDPLACLDQIFDCVVISKWNYPLAANLDG